MMHSIDKLDKLIENATKILILSHNFPDPDAVTSALGLKHYIELYFPGKAADVKIPNFDLNNFSFLTNLNQISVLTSFKEEKTNYDLFIFVDFQQSKMLDSELNQQELSELKVACIDHHPYEGCGYGFEYIDPSFASCADLIFEVLFRREIQNREVAFALFMGLLADSGSLMFVDRTKVRSIENAKIFIEKHNFSIEEGQNLLAEMTLEEFMLYKHYINNAKFDHTLQLTMSYSDFSVLNSYPRQTVKKISSKFLGSVSKTINNFNWAITLTPYNSTKYGISFRSTIGSVDLSALARHFNGGGHKRAAGGELIFDKPTSGEEATNFLLDKIKTLELVYN